MVYPALFFVEKLLGKYFDAQRELIQLRGRSETVSKPSMATQPLTDIDLGNTDQLASEVQHGPIYDWFHKRHIKARVNLHSVNTSGFFDEVAEAIGANLLILKEVLERILWSQQKGYASTTINLGKKSADDARTVSIFCQLLYDFSFVAKCFHNKPENNVRLIILQTAPAIRDFFNGE